MGATTEFTSETIIGRKRPGLLRPTEEPRPNQRWWPDHEDWSKWFYAPRRRTLRRRREVINPRPSAAAAYQDFLAQWPPPAANLSTFNVTHPSASMIGADL